jgi:hypothetical protein
MFSMRAFLMARPIFSAAISFVHIKLSIQFFFLNCPSAISLYEWSFIGIYLVLIFFIAREKLGVSFTE